MLGIVPSAGDTAVRKTDKDPCPPGIYNLEERVKYMASWKGLSSMGDYKDLGRTGICAV